MRFEVSHLFSAPPEQVTRVLLDPAFQNGLAEVGGLKERSVLGQERDGDGVIVRRIRCVLDIQVSGVARSMLGDGDPAWVQEERWDEGAGRCSWTIHPEVAAELLSAAGTIDVAAERGGSIRTVTGDVRVKVPLYGGKVERWIVDGVTRAYEEEAGHVERWLEREK